MELTVEEIARRLGGVLEGDGARRIASVAGVRDAGPADLAFVSQSRYEADAVASRAGAILVTKDWSRACASPLIRVDKPEVAFATAARWFAAPEPAIPAGVHPSAIVAADVVLGEGVSIGPLSVVEAGAKLGKGVVIGAQCYVGHRVAIGAGTRLYPQVSLREGCVIGERCILHNGTVVGSDGFGYDVDKQGVRTKIPQIGIVVIEDDVEIGANCTIDRARFGKTRIGKGVKIDNLVQIAHNVIIGDHAVIVAQVGIAGSTMIGDKTIIAGQSGVAGHLTIGPGTVVGARSGVTKDIPGGYVVGFPARPQKDFALETAMVARLPQLRERVAELAKRLDEIERRLPS